MAAATPVWKEPGFTLADYYNPAIEFTIEVDPKCGAVVKRDQIVPFECPECGKPMVCLSQRTLFARNGGTIEFWCRGNCWWSWRFDVPTFLELVPQAKEAVEKTKSVAPPPLVTTRVVEDNRESAPQESQPAKSAHSRGKKSSK